MQTTAELPTHVYITVELYDRNTARYEPTGGKINSKVYLLDEGVEKAGAMTSAIIDSVMGECHVIEVEQESQKVYVRANDVKFVTVHYVPRKS